MGSEFFMHWSAVLLLFTVPLLDSVQVSVKAIRPQFSQQNVRCTAKVSTGFIGPVSIRITQQDVIFDPIPRLIAQAIWTYRTGQLFEATRNTRKFSQSTCSINKRKLCLTYIPDQLYKTLHRTFTCTVLYQGRNYSDATEVETLVSVQRRTYPQPRYWTTHRSYKNDWNNYYVTESMPSYNSTEQKSNIGL